LTSDAHRLARRHKTKGPSYFVTNGVIASLPNEGNDLFAETEFANFVLRLEIKRTPANEAIRTALKADVEARENLPLTSSPDSFTAGTPASIAAGLR